MSPTSTCFILPVAASSAIHTKLRCKINRCGPVNVTAREGVRSGQQYYRLPLDCHRGDIWWPNFP